MINTFYFLVMRLKTAAWAANSGDLDHADTSFCSLRSTLGFVQILWVKIVDFRLLNKPLKYLIFFFFSKTKCLSLFIFHTSGLRQIGLGWMTRQEDVIKLTNKTRNCYKLSIKTKFSCVMHKGSVCIHGESQQPAQPAKAYSLTRTIMNCQ